MERSLMPAIRVLLLALLLLLPLGGVSSSEGPPRSAAGTASAPEILFTHGGAHLGLLSPFNYASIPAGTPVVLNVSGAGFTAIQYSVDGGPMVALEPPYTVPTGGWLSGTRILEVEALDGATPVATASFVFFINPDATWPPDTIPVDVILVGFPVAPGMLENLLTPVYSVVKTLEGQEESFNLTFDFSVHAASAAYQADLLAYLQSKARFRDDLQARLNLTALIDQRSDRIPRDIFDPLRGWEIDSDWVELYLTQTPPIPSLDPSGYTLYFLNLSVLDDPSSDVDHWIVEEVLDPDTRRPQDWWRLEWDNDLNTPMGYPLNSWGGPNHRLYVDPTAYQWYLDWAHVWFGGGTERAPWGLQWEEVPPTEQLDYLAGIVNDLIVGLAVDLPAAPPSEPVARIQNYVLSGSVNYSLDEFRWTTSDLLFQHYLEEVFPFKTWNVNTTFDLISNYPDLEVAVDENTTFAGGQGAINGFAVWDYLFANKAQYLPDDPDAFEVLSVNLLYDNRSMVFGCCEFTGLGGSGITAIFLKTDRLFDGAGLRQKGLTSVLAHETGHNLGYFHQFGPHDRADFIRGNMGYFQNDLEYGRFWEDALYRLVLRSALRGLLAQLEGREPIDLSPEFTAFYAAYRALEFREAYEILGQIESLLLDSTPPVADLRLTSLEVPEDVPVALDGGASSDNHRVVRFTWNFGDGTQVTGSEARVTKAWPNPGSYVVTLTVSDAAGNSADDSVSVTVLDTTAPTVQVTSPVGGTMFPEGPVTVTWTASDEGLGIQFIEIRLDGEPPHNLTPTTVEHTFETLANGSHVVTVTAVDEGGNRGLDAVAFTIGGSPGAAGMGLPFWVAAGAAVVLGVFVVVLLLLRRRRGSPPS